MPGTIAVLTREPLAQVQSEGGSGNWAANADRIRKYPFLVLVRNGKHPLSPTDVKHGTAFLVGRISGTHVAPASAQTVKGYPRQFIEISEFASISVPDVWSKSQNPVWFTDLKMLGIDESKLKFELIRPAAPQKSTLSTPKTDLDLADIKREIGLRYNVPASAVIIEIRL